MTISAAQSKAARALLDWSQTDLASACGLGESTIRDFEKGRRSPSLETLFSIEKAFQDHGIIFIGNGGRSDFGGEGVRFVRAETKEQDDFELTVATEALNTLKLEIVHFDQKIESSFREKEDNFPSRLALIRVSSSLKNSYDKLKREYNEIYKKVHGVDLSDDDGEFPF